MDKRKTPGLPGAIHSLSDDRCPILCGSIEFLDHLIPAVVGFRRCPDDVVEFPEESACLACRRDLLSFPGVRCHPVVDLHFLLPLSFACIYSLASRARDSNRFPKRIQSFFHRPTSMCNGSIFRCYSHDPERRGNGTHT